MKKYIPVLLFLLTLSSKAEMTPPPVGSVWIEINSSYWTLGSVGCYIYAAQALYWNTNNLQQWQDNRSGGSLLEAQNRLYKYGAAQAAHVTNSGNVYIEYWPDNNGGYTPSTWHDEFLNLIQAPGLMYDLTSYVDPGGIMASQAGTWKYVVGGSIPVGPAAGSHYYTGSADQLLDAQAQTDGAAHGYLWFGSFYYLDSYANWTNDILDGTKLREVSYPFGSTPDEEHPGTAGAFGMAVNALQQRIDTNVWTGVVNYLDSSIVSTNHCVITSVVRNGNQITVTIHPIRLSMPFDMPDSSLGKTNTCATVFTLQRAYSNAFYEVLALQNMPNGNWQVSQNGTNIEQTTGAILRGGYNWFAKCSGAMWNKRVAILDLYRTRYGYDTNTLVPSNGGTAFGEQTYQSNAQGFWNAGARGDTLINDLSSIWTTIHYVDTNIWAQAIPGNYVLDFRLMQAANISTNTIGTTHWGQ